jgi:uncharacterized coiled-coil DUF342 family protein
MTMNKTEDTLKERFKEACAERDAILAKSAPLRIKRDAIIAKARDLEKTADPLNEQIRKAETGLFDLHNEIATISRALKGQTA